MATFEFRDWILTNDISKRSLRYLKQIEEEAWEIRDEEFDVEEFSTSQLLSNFESVAYDWDLNEC